MPIRVLIVDDSALIRKVLSEILEADPEIEVVGTAADPYIARSKIKELNPDMLTLDVEMPRMDGLTFLRNLMRLHPMPVLMVSTWTEKGGDITLEAMALGAVDYVAKPTANVHGGLKEIEEEIRTKVKTVAQAKVSAYDPETRVRKPVHHSLITGGLNTRYDSSFLIGIGASTGGTEAILEILSQMPPDGPPVLVTQHIPPGFSASFARRLNENSAMNVFEAKHGMVIKPGFAYVAPGDSHLQLLKDGVNKSIQLNKDGKVNRHRPSVGVMFDSMTVMGDSCAAAILSGMGDDGANELLALKKAGAYTVAQDKRTCVVYGMSKMASELGAAKDVLPLDKIAFALLTAASVGNK